MQRAFTLVELMIVVAIVGIIAALAVPNFQKMTCKSWQSEAKTNGNRLLQLAQTSEEMRPLAAVPIFSSPCGTPIPPNVLTFDVKGNKRKYAYTVSKMGGAGTNLVLINVSGCGGLLTGDTWSASGVNPVFRNTANACD